MAQLPPLLAETPEPPYYAVVFTAIRTSDSPDFASTAGRMLELARQQPGYLGVESASRRVGSAAAEGAQDSFRSLSILVSYWTDEASISAWKRQSEHTVAQSRGRKEWYEHYNIRVCKVERAYSGGFGSL